MKLFIVLLCVCLQCCSQPPAKVESFDQYLSQQIDTRDSLFVIHTVKELARMNWYTYRDYSKYYHITNEEVEYFIGGVFYNSDKTKILVWVGEKKPNAESINKNRKRLELNRICPTAGDTIYSMSAIIGFRNKVSEIWKLYPFNQQQAVCFDSKEKVINVLSQYYFHQIANHQMFRMQQNGFKELEAYGYNLQDKDFWEKSWLWEKDTVASYGLYPFQIYGYNCNKENYDRIVETYPDRKPNETNGEYLSRNGRIVMKQTRNNLKECAEPYDVPEIEYPEEILKLYN